MKKKGGICRTCVPIASSSARVWEGQMAATLQSWAEDDLIPIFTLWNKQNPMADPEQCGKYRADFLYEWAEGVLILEYDEYAHANRDKRCELVRMAQMSLGYGGRPVFFIRYNPDAFKVAGKTLITARVAREKELLKVLQAMIGDADYDHFLTIKYLFYNKPETSDDNFIQTFKFPRLEDYEKWVDEVAPA